MKNSKPARGAVTRTSNTVTTLNIDGGISFQFHLIEEKNIVDCWKCYM